MKLSFLSLASGSSGNCYYLGTPEFGVLIDAGIGIRTIKKVLKDKAIDFSKIVAVLITHDHADHIKTVGCLERNIVFLFIRQRPSTEESARVATWRKRLSVRVR